MLSLESIKRQIDREGKRWGVFGVIKDGAVYAAAMGKVAEVHGDVGSLRDEPILLSRIDENHPFSAFLSFRIKRGQFDAMRRFEESAARRKKAQQAHYDDLAGDFKDRARRIVTRPITITVPR